MKIEEGKLEQPSVADNEEVNLLENQALAIWHYLNQGSLQVQEVFDIVNEENTIIGEARRSDVHARGLLHRAVHVLVFNSKQEMLLQQRSPRKTIGASQWDLSCAEHLARGETYLQARSAWSNCATCEKSAASPSHLPTLLPTQSAQAPAGPQVLTRQRFLSAYLHQLPGAVHQGALRGLNEELGIHVAAGRLAGPLAPAHQRELRVPGRFHDCEFVETYRLDRWEGPVSADAGEVADWRWAPLAAVEAEARQHPERFTAWFVEEMTLLGWLRAAGHRPA